MRVVGWSVFPIFYATILSCQGYLIVWMESKMRDIHDPPGVRFDWQFRLTQNT